MAKKATKAITDTGVGIDFENGEHLTVKLTQCSEEIVRRLALHGLSQKLGDSYAGAEADEAYGLAENVAQRLIAGDWQAARASGGGTSRVSALVEALATATGKTIDEALAVIKEMSDDQKKQLRAHPSVTSELAKIAATKAAAKAEKAAVAAQDAPALEL